MPFPVPTSLSPSRVESFTTCPLAFRFASIEKLPEPPSPHATKGSLVHRALELLFCEPAEDRTESAAVAALAGAVAEFRIDPEYTLLGLDADAEQEFLADAERLVRRYFELEDPRLVHEIGIELYLEARIGRLTVRGIIDRLELGPDGELVVTDYKTGRPPGLQHEQRRLGGVHFYSYLCEQVFGRRPARVQLLYLSTPEVLIARPSDQSTRYLPRRTNAVWQAVERACESGDFRPSPSRLCDSCAFKAWCPAFGGDPDRAKFEAPVAYGRGNVQLPLVPV
jgi:putative RecB family exonuclease